MFSRSAHLYDAIYTRMKDYSDEARKVSARIEEVRPGASSVLDVACGTGEHARHLAHRYRVDGIDADPHLLRIAADKHPSGRFEVADMTSFDLGASYDAVVCLFSSIGYVRTVAALEATLRCFERHLAPAGVVLVEPWFTPDAWGPGRVGITTHDSETLKICRMNAAEKPDERTSFIRFHYLVGTDGAVEYFTEEHTLGLFTVDEMLHAFAAAGLTARHDPVGLSGRGLYVATRT